MSDSCEKTQRERGDEATDTFVYPIDIDENKQREIEHSWTLWKYGIAALWMGLPSLMGIVMYTIKFITQPNDSIPVGIVTFMFLGMFQCMNLEFFDMNPVTESLRKRNAAPKSEAFVPQMFFLFFAWFLGSLLSPYFCVRYAVRFIQTRRNR